MSEISDEVAGLFGWVPAPPRGQGRPAYVWSRAKSNKCMVLFASGYKPKDVASVLGCDVKTLRKVFSRECKAAATAELIVRSGMMARLVDEAEGGKVAAIKQLDKMMQAERVKVLADHVQHRGKASAEPKAPVLGKKDAAKKAADSMPGKYATRQAPQGQLIN